jgi:hypothetical protein
MPLKKMALLALKVLLALLVILGPDLKALKVFKVQQV